MNDERNFRSLYYEKVGCKGFEEKKTLEILFKEETLDKSKMSQFCSRFTVPLTYRSFVWKLLLGVIPAHKSCHEFVMKERTEQYNDLLRSLKVLNYITENSPKEDRFLQMWLLENYRLMHDKNTQINIEFNQNLLAVTRTLMQIFENDVDVFWIAKGFYQHIKSWYSALPHLIETTISVLKKEDSVLHRQLSEQGLLEALPLPVWFGRCFAGLIHDAALVKVWDKLVAAGEGGDRLLVCVCLCLLTQPAMRRRLLACQTRDQLLACLTSVTDEMADVVVTRSLEIWSTSDARTLIAINSHIRGDKH